MSLDKDTRTTIVNSNVGYNRKVKAIRDNPDLSAEGKRKALAKLYTHQQAAVATMRQAAAGNVAKRRTDLEKQLFAVGGDPMATMAYRDAVSRANAVKTGHDAQLMMRQAKRDGDEYLARALFSRGFDQARDRLTGAGWGEVVDEYVGTFRPELGPAVTELATLQNADTKRARLEESVATGVNRPPELQGVTDHDMRGLVEQDGGEAA